MNNETDHKSGHEVASRSPSLRHSSTYRQSLRLGKVPSGAQNEGLVFGATDAISSHHATSQEIQNPTPEPHSEPTRSVVSKDSGDKVCGENIETKKEKNEIEQTAQTPQTRKKEATSNIIQPTGELCGLSVTCTSDYTAAFATHTDKSVWRAMSSDAGASQWPDDVTFVAPPIILSLTERPVRSGT